MAVSYDRAVAGRRKKVSAAGKAEARVFEGAYAFAMQIVELREQRGLTQKELAARSGVDQADISRLERGSAFPNEKTLLRIAEALDADLALIARNTQ
jgi:ribosome-binding protein aMBF1 (putative translation factor)